MSKTNPGSCDIFKQLVETGDKKSVAGYRVMLYYAGLILTSQHRSAGPQ